MMLAKKISHRTQSLIVTHVANLISALGSGMVTTGIWPYLQAVSVPFLNHSYIFLSLIYCVLIVRPDGNIVTVRICGCFRCLRSNAILSCVWRSGWQNCWHKVPIFLVRVHLHPWQLDIRQLISGSQKHKHVCSSSFLCHDHVKTDGWIRDR